MVSKTTKIINETGLHMRPANVFVTAMSKYSSDIKLTVNQKIIDGKSIMSIMAACIKYNSEITVECDGPDEQKMLDEAINLIESGFDE